MPSTPEPLLQQLRAGTLALLLALVVLGMAWELVLAPTGSGSLAIKVLPLALALPGLLKHRLYTYRWLSLLVWLYVAEALVRSTTEGGVSRWLAVGELALCLAIFVTATVYIRRRLRAAPVEAAA